MTSTAPKIERVYELTSSQRAMLAQHLADPDGMRYIVQKTFVVEGDFDAAAASRAASLLADRHEILRASIYVSNDGDAKHVVLTDRRIEVFTSTADTVLTDMQLARLARGFDLRRDPLVRLHIMNDAPQVTRLVWTFHHIILDGWSLAVLLSDFFSTYEKLEAGLIPDRMTTPSFGDHVERLRGQGGDASIDFWRAQLEALPPAVPSPYVVPSPAAAITDEAAPSMSTTKPLPHQVVARHLGQDLSERLTEFAGETGLTRAPIFQFTWGLLLARERGTRDILLGRVVSGRDETRERFHEAVGMYVNTLPTRVTFTETCTVLDALLRMAQFDRLARSHEQLPWSKIHHDIDRGAELASLFVFENYPVPTLNSSGKYRVRVEDQPEFSEFALTLAVTTFDGHQVNLGFDSAVVSKIQADRILRRYLSLLERVLADPTRLVADVPLLDDDEATEVARFSRGPSPEPVARSFADRLLGHIVRSPNRHALMQGGNTMTYRQLGDHVGRVRGALDERGVQPGQRVGVLGTNSLETIATAVAVAASGRSFVLIDSGAPFARTKKVMKESSLRAVISTEPVDVSEIDAVEIITLPGDLPSEAPFENIANRVGEKADPDREIYMIFTSGSTGTPKGVALTELGVLLLADELQQQILSAHGEVNVGLLASIAFDASLQQVFAAVLNGHTLDIIPHALKENPASLWQYLDDHRIHLVDGTPSFWGMMLSVLRDDESRNWPKTLLVGGERMPPSLVGQTARHLPGTSLFNVYGLSETTVDNVLHRTRPSDANMNLVPVGRPLSHTEASIRLACGTLAGVGVVGEIHLSGPAVARGYGGALAAHGSFPIHPASGWPVFETGDLGYWSEEGLLHVLGRRDSQLKINGYRIEPADVEHALLEIDNVAQAAVVTDMGTERARLVAFVVTADGLRLDDLRRELSLRLPTYMIPHTIEVRDSLPRTSSGKVDRRALQQMLSSRELLSPHLGHSDRNNSPAATRIMEVVGLVLRRETVSIDDDFFSLGGDSLDAIRVVAMLSEYNVTVADILSRPVLRELAAYIHLRTRAIDQSPLVGPVPLFPIHRQMYRVTTAANVHHFTQSLLFEASSSLTIDAVSEAAQRLVHHHDALRARFAHGDAQLVIVPPGDAKPEVIYLEAPETDLDGALRRVHSSLRPSLGSTIAFALIRQTRCTLVSVAIHHAVSDAVSLRIIAEDFETLLSEGRHAVLPPRTDSILARRRELTDVAATTKLSAEEGFWRKQFPSPPARTRRHRTVTVGDTGVLDRTLVPRIGAAERSELERRGLSVHAVLTAAFAGAYAHVFGGGEPTLLLEGHGRDLPDSELNIARTVGWFTAPYPLRVPLGRSTPTLGDCVRVQQTLNSVPNGGLGFSWALWDHMSEDEHVALNASSPIFNYLGDATPPGGSESSGLLRLLRRPPVAEVHQDVLVENPMVVNVVIHDGLAHVSLRHPKGARARDRARRLLRRMDRSLGRIFRELSVRSLSASILGELGATAATEMVSVLNPDGGTDIFVFPPAMLRVAYIPLYDALFSTMTKYRVHVLHMTDDPAPEAAFAAYVHSVVDSTRPFAFFGYSGGANLAYETGIRLQEQGLNVSHMLFLDGFKWETGLEFAALDEESVDNMISTFLDDIGLREGIIDSGRITDVLATERDAFLHEGRRYGDYALTHRDRTETLTQTKIFNVLSEDRPSGPQETRRAWQEVTLLPVSYIDGRGSHLTMLTDYVNLKENARMISEVFDSWQRDGDSAQIVVSARGLSRDFGRGATAIQALKDVDFDLRAGEFVVILGSSGSGKSTLLNVVSTLDRPDEGSVAYSGVGVDYSRKAALRRVRREVVGFIFQAYNLVPTLTARDNVLLGAPGSDAGDVLEGLVRELGIAEILGKYPSQLSGGQQQRVAIARALVKRPAVLYCDEPTGALDTANSISVLRLLCAHRDAHGTAIVMVTHNPLIAQLADRVLTMRDGRIVAESRSARRVSVDEIEWS